MEDYSQLYQRSRATTWLFRALTQNPPGSHMGLRPQPTLLRGSIVERFVL